MGHNEKDWSGEGKCIRNAAKFCAAPLVISLSLHTLKYPKGQISCVIQLLEVYIFPLSMEIIFCALSRVAQRNVPKWPCIQEPLLAAGLKLAFLSPYKLFIPKKCKTCHVVHIQGMFTVQLKSR